MSSSRTALRGLPPCATTGIGSLPHTQLEPALQLAWSHDIPFLPQLPRELMIAAALDGLPGLASADDGACVVNLEQWHAGRDDLSRRIEESLSSSTLTTFEPAADVCRAFKPFLLEVESRHLPFAKVQLAGPATVRWVTRTTDGRSASTVPELDQQIFRLLLAKGLALVKAVQRTNTTPIIFLDEPCLSSLDVKTPQHLLVLKELQLMATALQREGAIVGLHCCSNTQWGAVLDLGFDIISIDARLSLDALLEDRDAWRRFITSGATLSLGIVPTDLNATYALEELCESVEASLRAMNEVPFTALLSRMLLTPACGLALHTVADAHRIVAELHDAQRRLRALTL